ncbi:ribonuclease [Novosphingobium colocasiae]|uniref:ribonuclease n=1 Tax=Novosphingobium colocasiae TaxID=1256513 RepID=UPI0035B4ACB6
MAEAPARTWLVEEGIGETRAILVENDQVIAARLDRPGRLVSGQIEEATLIARAKGATRGTVRFAGGEEALVDGLEPSASEGAPLRVEVTRTAIAETGRLKRAQGRPTTKAVVTAPSLAQRLRREGAPVKVVTRFAEDPWPELIAQALDGTFPFAGGALLVTPTPAMTLIDIDGTLPPRALALAAIPPIAAAVGLLDLGGSIGIDFPSLERREDRRAVDEALAAALAHWPHQRTAMNGFGFVQLVARLERPSLIQTLRQDPALAGALLLLRQATFVAAPGRLLLTAHPRVCATAAQHEAELMRRSGRTVIWQEDSTLALTGGFAQAIAA